MSIIEYLKGEIEAIGILIEQKTKEIESLTKRQSDLEKEIKGSPKEEKPVETKKAKAPKDVEEALEEEEAKAAYASWDRDKLKAELESRKIEFAKNAKTEKLVALLEESDQ